jgi:hypothetical protein
MSSYTYSYTKRYKNLLHIELDKEQSSIRKNIYKKKQRMPSYRYSYTKRYKNLLHIYIYYL